MGIIVGDPEGIQRHIQMIATERQARFFRFMEELPPTDLAILIEMLHVIIQSENGATIVGKMIGEAGAIMRLKHNDACMGCGQQHDVEMLKEAAEEVAREREQQDPAFQAALEEYNMEIADGKLRCKGCGIESVSLDDRMRRAPGSDGCHGCKNKAAWG